MDTRPREEEKAQEASQAGLVFLGQQIRNKRSIDSMNLISLLASFSPVS